jgi:hypothetical protein
MALGRSHSTKHIGVNRDREVPECEFGLQLSNGATYEIRKYGGLMVEDSRDASLHYSNSGSDPTKSTGSKI